MFISEDVLSDLSKAVLALGGSIMSVGSFYGDVIGEWGIVIRVGDAKTAQLVDMLEALGDHVVDARDV